MVNYGVFERAIGLNWYTVDPNLRALMDRLLDPADREWAEGHLVRIGALCGGPIAERAETIDKSPPGRPASAAPGCDARRSAGDGHSPP